MRSSSPLPMRVKHEGAVHSTLPALSREGTFSNGIRPQCADAGFPELSSATKVISCQIRLSRLGRVSTNPVNKVAKPHNAAQNHIQMTVIQQQHRCTLAGSFLLSN